MALSRTDLSAWPNRKNGAGKKRDRKKHCPSKKNTETFPRPAQKMVCRLGMTNKFALHSKRNFPFGRDSMKNTTTSKDSKKSVLVHEIVKKSVFGLGASRPCRKRKKKKKKRDKNARPFSASAKSRPFYQKPELSQKTKRKEPALALGSNSSRPFDQKPQMPRKQK